MYDSGGTALSAAAAGRLRILANALVVLRKRVRPRVPEALGLAWFVVSCTTLILSLVQLHALVFSNSLVLGRGIGFQAAVAALAFAGISGFVALAFVMGRPWTKRIGAVLALVDFFVSLFLALLPVVDAFRSFMFARAFLDGLLIWMATEKDGPLRLPRVNRDLAVVVFVIGGVTAWLGTIYGFGIFQFLINGIVVGSIYVLGATGLSLIFGIRKFANFAHGELMTFGAYMALFINATRYMALDILWGFIFAIVTTAIVAMILELVVFRKLAGRGPVPALVASIGVAIFLQNLVAAIFGTTITTYNLQVSVNIVVVTIDGQPVLTIPPIKGIAVLIVSSLLTLGLHLLLSATTLGKAMRATADNADLARASGINVRNVILWTWAIGGALAAVAGVLLGVVLDVRTTLGFSVLLFVFAAVIVGGLGSPYGAMLGGLVVGIGEELSVALLAWLGRPSVIGLTYATAYKPVAAFLIMILVLLLRPEGLAAGKTHVIRARAKLFRLRWPKGAKAE